MWLRGWFYQGLALLALLIVRTGFMVWNRAFLAEEAPLFEVWLRGMGLDWVAATWVCLPMWALLVVGAERPARFIWMLSLSLALALEVIDIGFFPYSHRRSGPELIRMLSFWEDSLPALGKYARDFLAGFLFWGGLVGGIWLVSRLRDRVPVFVGKIRWIGWLVSLGLLVLGGRGGFRLKPLLVVDASIAGCPTCMSFVLNTTFFFIRSVEQPSFPIWPPMPSQALPYPRPWHPDSTYAAVPRYNVVLFILESFSQEYVEEGYALFLSSILKKGRCVKWGFATNSRSAEGVPAILSSTPSLGEEPLIFTPYVSRIRHSLAEILRHWGYTTAFFHGGNDGTMVLDSYTRQAGFMHYFGRKSYPYPDRDYDGTWGIWDAPFLQFCADQLDKLPQPFLAVVFTLSSHHPYAVPSSLADSFPSGPLPIHRSIRYADWALRRFFDRIQHSTWAKRTLFVFTADHTGPSQNAYHSVRVFHVPIGFYTMETTLPELDTIGSQMDILPTVLEAVGYPDSVCVWGRSLWAREGEVWTIQKPLPFFFQAIGRRHIVHHTPQGETFVYKWEGVPWVTQRCSELPPWYEDWISYLASYGRWIERGEGLACLE
ncbi:MAG: LTA synthase family protein [Bacteroidia bacterium]|nr:LTA synthase family protein [Bacteroidia bacterium]